MNQGANVGSIAAVRDFRAALVTFVHDAREAVTAFDLESRRCLEWLAETAPRQWQEEGRRAEDAVTEARIELERCRASKLPGGEPRSCLEERKALERAKHRREHAADKLQLTRRWSAEAEREGREYAGRARQLESLFDAHLARAIASLDATLTALESYVAAGSNWSNPDRPSAAPAAAAGSVARPAEEPPADPAAEEPRE